MSEVWAHGVPSLERRLEVVEALAAVFRSAGLANFLYADGDALFAHAAGVLARRDRSVLRAFTCSAGGAAHVTTARE